MKSIKTILFSVLFTLSFSLVAQNKCVFILIDGVPADVVEDTPTPNIDEIAQQGGYTRAYLGGGKGTYSESPTVSAPGYNHLLTGTWSNKHNVRDNEIKHPNYHYPTIFRIVKDVRPDIRTAIFSTWLDNRTKLIGEGLPQTGRIKMDYAFDGFEQDTVAFPHINQADGFEWAFFFDIDEHVSKEAARYIRENGPDLSWVYLEHPDDIGHYYGDGPKMTKVVEDVDVQIGRIWEAVKQRMKKTGEKWMVVITTDHGRNSKNGKSHGGQSDRERTTWIATNFQPLNNRFRQNPGIIDIMPSILRFIDIEIPVPVKEEIDGVPFVGPVSVSELSAKSHNDRVNLSWKVLDSAGEAEIWVATTNTFKEGKKDNYQLVGKTDVSKGEFQFDVSNMKSDFYKILVKTPGNWVNYWIVK